jgi:hypothetical protein
MTAFLEVEVVVKSRTPDRTQRPLHIAIDGGGVARAVAGELDVDFTVSPPPVDDENVWVLLARIASEGARAQQMKYGLRNGR